MYMYIYIYIYTCICTCISNTNQLYSAFGVSITARSVFVDCHVQLFKYTHT